MRWGEVKWGEAMRGKVKQRSVVAAMWKLESGGGELRFRNCNLTHPREEWGRWEINADIPRSIKVMWMLKVLRRHLELLHILVLCWCQVVQWNVTSTPYWKGRWSYGWSSGHHDADIIQIYMTKSSLQPPLHHSAGVSRNTPKHSETKLK